MLGAAFLKDLRLLARDRAALVFLTVAPVLVIAVAGLSLASLYGADPRGTSAYLLPLADEDGGRVGQTLRARLAAEPRVVVEVVADRAAARALVRRQVAGAALVIPAGTTAAVARGEPAALLLYTDPVKYLEVANVRLLVEELRHGIEATARARAAARLEKERAHAARARARFERSARGLERTLEEVNARLRAARAEAERRLAAAEAEAGAETDQARARLAATLAPLRGFLAELAARQQAFAEWLAAARAQAGRFADRLAPPPAPPEVPPALAALAADPDALVGRVLPSTAAARPVLPPMPTLPPLALPTPPAPPDAHLPGALGIEESSVTGAPRQLNTFDQNVPGFSVTFLLLGMLLGVSLGLLDERDWGTLERLRAMPAPFATVLVAKLLARFAVGVVQMAALFAVGRLAFGISLGPQPWALALPAAGIVFAGTAFGLVVAGAARSRESVLPLGSIVIVTMAAVGGCWWPIDLEPRWMRQVALAFPTTWAMAAFNDLMIRRQRASAAALPTAVLFGFGLFYLAVGLLVFRGRTAA
ncbi:MAG TPA: ABC transporter permease [Candidatus Binatia bacterium]|nr:ABC transporter permease [Candidatus Binatia bacterium]